MPRGDGTGPLGQGPGTGCGRCVTECPQDALALYARP